MEVEDERSEVSRLETSLNAVSRQMLVSQMVFTVVEYVHDQSRACVEAESQKNHNLEAILAEVWGFLDYYWSFLRSSHKKYCYDVDVDEALFD